MRILLFIFAALAAFPQAQTPFRIIQSSGSLSGELWQQEPRSGGQNYFKAKIPVLAADVSLTYPNALPATNGECWTATTAGISSWLPCAAGTAITNNGNTFGTVVSIGTNDAFALRFEVQNVAAWEIATTGEFFPLFNNSLDIGKSAATIRTLYAGTSIVTPKIGRDTSASLTLMTDGFDRWIVNSAGMLYPATDDTYDFGLTGTRVRGIYAKFGEFYKSGSTSSSDYLTTRKYNILDQAGGSGSWDLQASGSMAATSKIMLRDNAGSRLLEAWRALSGSPLNYTSIFSSLIPAKRLIASGDAVDDSVFPDNGATGSRWANYYGVAMDLTGSANIIGDLSASIINATGSPAYRVAGTTVITAARAATFTGLTIPTGASTGYVWTDTGSGVGAWASPAGVTAPLTLTLGASGYSVPLVVRNDTVGLNGSCIEVAGHDSGSTVYSLGRLCAKFDSALFTDELVSLMTATGGGTWATAQSWKNLTTAHYGNTSILNDSSLLMDRAARATNQKAYWTVAGNPATTGAWSTGTTPSGAASRWVIEHNGTEHLTIEEAGTITTSGGLTATGNLTGAIINMTGSAYRVGGTTVIFSSRNASFVDMAISGVTTFGSTISSDFIPTTSNLYTNGSSGSYWNAVRSETFFVEGGRIRPTTTNTGSVGLSTARFNKGWFTDFDFTGTIVAPSGATYNGTTSCGALEAVKTIVVSQGLVTSITCGTP